jgi:hypothetical protein
MKPVANLSDDEFSHLVQRAVRELPDAPPSFVHAALAQWPATGPLAALASSFAALAQAVAHRITAAVTFDSWATPALASGMRSAQVATRHLLYSAQGRDIDLRIAPSAEYFSMAGQILGPDEAGMVELSHEHDDGREAFVTALDALGEFRIDGIRRGTYVMTLRMGGDEIVLPPVEVGERVA